MGLENVDVPLVRPSGALGHQGPGQTSLPSRFPRRGGRSDGASGNLPLPSVALGPIHLSEVRCRGYEQTLGDCPSLKGPRNGCQHENDAAVRCNIPDMGFRNQVSSGLGSPEIAQDTLCSWGQGVGVQRASGSQPLELAGQTTSPDCQSGMPSSGVSTDLAYVPWGQALAFTEVRIWMGTLQMGAFSHPPSQVPGEVERDGA